MKYKSEGNTKILLPVVTFIFSLLTSCYPGQSVNQSFIASNSERTQFYSAVQTQLVDSQKPIPIKANTVEIILETEIIRAQTLIFQPTETTEIYAPTNTSAPPTKTKVPSPNTTVPLTPTMKPNPSYDECKYSSGDVRCIIPKADCEYRPDVNGQPTFCNDAPYPNNNFTYLVWGQDVSYLDGRCIIVYGKIEYYNGKPQISWQSNDGFDGYCD